MPANLARSLVIDVDWEADVERSAETQSRLAAWAVAAVENVETALAAIEADELPLTVVHGDFAEWNVHYEGDRLAGVLDFELTHLDSRPYELAIARTYRSPEAIEAYAGELVRLGWPLGDLERAAIGPVYRAFASKFQRRHLLNRRQRLFRLAGPAQRHSGHRAEDVYTASLALDGRTVAGPHADDGGVPGWLLMNAGVLLGMGLTMVLVWRLRTSRA